MNEIEQHETEGFAPFFIFLGKRGNMKERQLLAYMIMTKRSGALRREELDKDDHFRVRTYVRTTPRSLSGETDCLPTY